MQQQQTARERAVVFLLNVLATIQVVWFYVIRVPSYRLNLYEQGQERMPYQGRILMRFPLVWASHSVLLQRAADWMTRSRLCQPYQVLPEDVLEFFVYLAAVAGAGLVARILYRSQSSSGRLIHYVYPLFLMMVAVTYCLVTSNYFRYIYDLPSLGLFAAGLLLIYRYKSTPLFVATVIVATINRETSLFLLVLFVQQRCMLAGRFYWKRMLTFRTGGVVAGLGLFWLGFHLWLKARFGPPPAGVKPGVMVNLAIALWPFAWPQLLAIGSYMLPLLLLLRPRRLFTDRRLAWVWVLPLWLLVMGVYGNLIEVRLFGEFLPLLAPTVAVLWEEELFEGAPVEASSC